MTLCFIDHGQCRCQPDEGVPCPAAPGMQAALEYVLPFVHRDIRDKAIEIARQSPQDQPGEKQ